MQGERPPEERPSSEPTGPSGSASDDRRFRFPKAYRLRKRAEFDAVTRGGVRRFSASFIFFLRRSEATHSRLGVTVSRKVGGAVVRNRVKRLLREAFRLHPDLFRWPVDMVVIAKRDVRARNLHEVVREFEHVLRHYYRNPTGSAPSRRRGGSRRGGSRPRRRRNPESGTS